MTEDEMVGWHHQLDGNEFEQAPEVGEGQGSLVVSAAAPDLERLLLNHDTGILGPRRGRIQSGARDEAWSLRAFV